MDQITSKEKVLKNIRKAFSALEPIDLERIDWDAPIYQNIEDSPDIALQRIHKNCRELCVL